MAQPTAMANLICSLRSTTLLHVKDASSLVKQNNAVMAITQSIFAGVFVVSAARTKKGPKIGSPKFIKCAGYDYTEEPPKAVARRQHKQRIPADRFKPRFKAELAGGSLSRRLRRMS